MVTRLPERGVAPFFSVAVKVTAWLMTGEGFDVADTQDIEKGKMGLVEVERAKVVIANVEGRFCAFNDRCPHMNAPLHLGTLHGKVIRCALLFSSYEVTTGEKLSDPTELSRESSIPPDILQKLTANLLKTEKRTAEIRR